jgi:hypothetical protein
MEEHVIHLSKVLQLLRDNQLTAKKSKCTFTTNQVEYLGHIISGAGLPQIHPRYKQSSPMHIQKHSHNLEVF